MATKPIPAGSESAHDILRQRGHPLDVFFRPRAVAVVIGVSSGHPVYLRDVAGIVDGASEPSDYVLVGF